MKDGTGWGTSLGRVETSEIRRSCRRGRALPDEFGLLAQLLEYGAPGEAPGGAGLAPRGAGGAAGPALQGHAGGVFLQHTAAATAAVQAPPSSWASAALLLTPGHITKPGRNSILSVLWIRMNPHPDQFTDDKPNISLFEHFFKGLNLYLEAGIWIRIRIRVKSWTRIRIKQKQNPHQGDKSNPDPHQGDADPQHCSILGPTVAIVPYPDARESGEHR